MWLINYRNNETICYNCLRDLPYEFIVNRTSNKQIECTAVIVFIFCLSLYLCMYACMCVKFLYMCNTFINYLIAYSKSNLFLNNKSFLIKAYHYNISHFLFNMHFVIHLNISRINKTVEARCLRFVYFNIDQQLSLVNTCFAWYLLCDIVIFWSLRN